MKICTLIVRLLGLSLVFTSGAALYQLQRAKSMMGGLGNPFSGDIVAITVVQLIIGLVAAIFAGKLARLLTFDAGRDDY